MLGTILVTQAVLPHLTIAGRTHHQFRVGVGVPPDTHKFDLLGIESGGRTLTHAWSKELGPKGITVNAIAPGVIETEMTTAILAERGAGIIASTPLGRIGQPEDIAGIALFLCSSEAGWITGRTIIADGGVT